MLIENLGYRPPTDGELNEILKAGKSKRRLFQPVSKKAVRQVALLYAEPLICYAGTCQESALGFASDVGGRLRKRESWFLITPTWSLIAPGAIEKLRKEAVKHRSMYSRHKFVFMCNTPQEMEAVQNIGEAAIHHTKTASVSEGIFRPLLDSDIKYDAVYNAQMRKWKRQDLTMGIESCAHIYYRAVSTIPEIEEEHDIAQLLSRECPKHALLNIVDSRQKPIRFLPSQVNQILNKSRVGLCLSKVEGPMLASVEYMLSGLPVVSTPSEGGREVFFDDEYCIIVDENPRSVAEAVDALKAKNIPRDYIQEQTLKKLEAHRFRFLTLINQILEESNANERITMDWPFMHTPTSNWLRVSGVLKDAMAYRVHDFGQVGAFYKID